MFDSWNVLALGLITGLAFGFLLQKAGVTKFDVIVNQFLLRDFTVLKVMLTAIVVGGVGVYALYGMDLTKLSVKPAWLVANVGGGLVFGIGMALAGLCPGTGVAALAEGDRRAAFGVLGMLFGAFVAAEAYGPMASALRSIDLGPATLATVTGLPAWAWLGGLALVALATFAWLEFQGNRSPVEVAQPSQAETVNA